MPHTFPACPALSRHALVPLPQPLSGLQDDSQLFKVPGPLRHLRGLSRPWSRKSAGAVTRLLQGKINTEFLDAWDSLTSSHRGSRDLQNPEKPMAPKLTRLGASQFPKASEAQVRQLGKTPAGDQAFPPRSPQIFIPVVAVIHCLMSFTMSGGTGNAKGV